MKIFHHVPSAVCALLAGGLPVWAECPCQKGANVSQPAPMVVLPVAHAANQPFPVVGPSPGTPVPSQPYPVQAAPQPYVVPTAPIPSVGQPMVLPPQSSNGFPQPMQPAAPYAPGRVIVPPPAPATMVAPHGTVIRSGPSSVIQSEEDLKEAKRNQSLPAELRSNSGTTVMKKHHETDPPGHYTYGDGFSPPPGNLGRLYTRHTEPLPIDKSPRGALVRIHLPESATISSPGMKVKWNGRHWELEPQDALLPGIPSIITIKATVPTESGDVTQFKWVRLWWNRIIDVEF